MKIFMAHNRYLAPGGEDISFRMEADMLRRNGCEVVTFEDNNRRIADLGAWRTAVRSVWSPEAYRRVRAKLRETRCDIVHVQNFFPLISPSIYYAARAEGVPVVQSLRNYRLMCPMGTLSRNGRICEDCIGRPIPWPSVRHGCYRDSNAASGAVAAMLTVNRMLGTWGNMVDAYIALSPNMRKRFVRGGLPAHKIFVKSNFLHPDPLPGAGDGDFAVFVGRLSPEKGVRTLMTAWKDIGGELPLKVVGAGPLESCVNGPDAPANVEFLGWQPEAEVLRLMGAARLVIIPTEWYEGQPRTAIEAFAKAAPVIASDIGAMAELVDDGRNGLLFPPGDAVALAARVRWALANRDAMTEMGARARRDFERNLTAKTNFGSLMDIYGRAIAIRRGTAGERSADYCAGGAHSG